VPGDGSSARRALVLFAVASVAALVLALGTASSPAGSASSNVDCQQVAADRSAWVSCMLDAMSVEEKVGQMFVVNGFGDSVDASDSDSVMANQTLYGPEIATIEDLIAAYKPGGIVYFDWSNDLTSPQQIVQLSNGVQRAALAQPTPTPMLISTDQEQGEVLRIGSPATVLPGNMALGATRSTRRAFRNAAITGRELRAMGINVDNAPVVDVNTNPKNAADGIRAFGDRTGFVSRFGAAQVRGYQGPGQVSAVAKHWPGLGDTETNPDTGVAVSNQTLPELATVSFPAFKAAIRAGVDQVMVTHIVMPNIQPSGIPTSLSRRFVHGLLRNRLGYRGVVITDALNAQALDHYTPEQVALLAIRAGNDLLLEIAGGPPDGPNAQSNFIRAYEAVLGAVDDGRIGIARIEQSVRRILRSKWNLGLADDPFAPASRVNDVVGTRAHLDVARRTAAQSITLLKNRGGVLPLEARSDTRVLVTGESQTPMIANEIASRNMTTQSLTTGGSPTLQQIRQVRRAARQYDLVVVNTFNVWASQPSGQVRLVRALIKTGKPVIVIALGTPYDIAYFRKVTAFVSAYSFQPVSVNAAVAALFGHINPRGRLPVTVPKRTRPQQTLYPFGFGLSY
jgi:beta-N-acetylhexosaminidase